MFEFNRLHPIDYRKELITTFFERVRAAESCVIVGAASMGKTHLQDFMTHSSVIGHYLESESAIILFPRVDCNRLAERSEWGFYELMLTALVESSIDHPKASETYKELNELRQVVIVKRDPLLGLRELELAVRLVIKNLGFKVCFLLDEFDDIYRNLPAQTLAHLRGLRDANKSRLCYTLFLRNTPEYVRNPADCESFYELFSHFVFGLQPYVSRDAEEMLKLLEERRTATIHPKIKATLLDWCGRHPGLILATFRLAVDHPEWFQEGIGINPLLEETIVKEECQKLLNSISKEEQEGFAQFLNAQNIPANVYRQLALKGLIASDNSNQPTIPLLAHYVKKYGEI
jgi:hypothetical protein